MSTEHSFAPVPLADGSAAIPTLTFNNDRDTGLFRKADNTIGVAVGGVEVGSFDSTGFITDILKFTSSVVKVTTKVYVMLDDGVQNLPTHTSWMFGIVVAGDNQERSLFFANAAGTVVLVSNSTNVIANSDTDADVCIGTGVANPIVLKNRLGGTLTYNVILFYV